LGRTVDGCDGLYMLYVDLMIRVLLCYTHVAILIFHFIKKDLLDIQADFKTYSKLEFP
jgi:hypothetical protein